MRNDPRNALPLPTWEDVQDAVKAGFSIRDIEYMFDLAADDLMRKDARSHPARSSASAT